MSPKHLLLDSTPEEWSSDHHLLIVQAAMINQIAQVTRGKVVLEEVLHSIALQLQDTLEVSGCVILQPDQSQPMVAPNHSVVQEGQRQSSTLLSPNVGGDSWERELGGQGGSRDVPVENLYGFYQYHHSWLAQGKPVIVQGDLQQLPPALQNAATESGVCAVLMVPLLHRQSYLGAITLYQCGNEREWMPQEIAFVQAIADHCAIALYQTEFEKRYQIELRKRQESESLLRESQRRLGAICDQSRQLIGLLSPEGTVLEVNQTVLTFTGLPAQDILGRPFWEARWWIFSFEATRQLREVLSQQLRRSIAASASGEFIQYEVDVLDARDRVATIDFSLKPVRDETGQVVLLIFEGRDITDYKQAESALQASVARNCALLEAIPDEIFRVTRDGIYLDWKAAKEEALTVRASEVIGKHLHDCLPTQVAGLIWHHVELALETKEIQIVEYQLWLNGKSRHFEARIVKSASDEVAVIVQDITERVQVRVTLEQVNEALEIRVEERTAALKEANHTLRAEIVERQRAEEQVRFLHSITKAIFESQDFHAALSVALQKVCEATGWDFGEAWVPRADGSALECSPAWYGKTERLEQFRRASETLTFSPGTGLPGRVWVSKQPEWRRDVSAESNAIYLRSQVAREAGLKAGLGIPIIANDTILAVLVFYMFEPRDEDQQLIKVISASTELGLMIQRKRAEGEIRKALVKEKELTELKSRFITMTSHEFRTPLTTIQSSAELLEHYSHNWTDQRKFTHLHRIQLSVKHMTKLLNDVLILGKADAGKLKLNPVPLDLESFCRNLVEELQLNDTNQNTITFTCSQGIGERKGLGRRGWGLGEEHSSSNSKTEQLIENSFFPVPSPQSPVPAKFPCMDEKLLRQILENLLSNAIKYSPKGSTVEFTLSYVSNQAVFQICDRGIGIPTEDQPMLFETFHRATNVGTIAGTGLGLAIVKKCVDIHQGHIAVESQVGVGTTFTVTLPISNLQLTS